LTKIAILGGNGFVGKNLQVLLHQKGFAFTSLNSVDCAELLKGFRSRQGTKIEFDTIINLTSKYNNRSTLLSEEEFNKMVNLPLEFISKFSNQNTLVVNTSSFVQRNLMNFQDQEPSYVLAKSMVLTQLTDMGVLGNIKFVDFNIFTLFGPWDRANRFIPTLFQSLKTHQILNCTLGEQLVGYVPVAKLCDSIWKVMMKEREFSGANHFSLWPKHIMTLRKLIEDFLNSIAAKGHVQWGSVPYTGQELMKLPTNSLPYFQSPYNSKETPKDLKKLWEMYLLGRITFI
jgi:nucleoside-diphosphate-sugar epimerase